MPTRLRKVLLVLLGLNVVGIPALWIPELPQLLGSAAPPQELVPGHSYWNLSFALPDLWLWCVSAIALARLWRGSIEGARPFLAATGAIMIYIVIHVVAYEDQAGLLLAQAVGDPSTIALKVVNLVAGSFFFACAVAARSR